MITRTRIGALRLLATAAAAAATAILMSGCDDDGPTVETADTVYINAKVVTVDNSSNVAEAFAVKNGRFIAVGRSNDLQRHIGAATQVVDLKGRTVIPGLSDGHFHSAGGGSGIDLSKTRSLAEMFAKITEAAAKAPAGTLLVSNGDWHEAQLKEQRTPLAAEIEAAAPGYPVVLVRGGHSYFLNTSALAKWGITTSTTVPAGGAIPRDPSGNLTGELVDTARNYATLPATPAPTLDSILAEQKVLNSYGLTNVRVPGTSVSIYRQLQQLRDAGQSTVRYSILFRGTAASMQTAGIKPNEGDAWLKVWGIKLGVDGGFEGAFMTRAYAEPMGQGGTYFGLQTITQSAFNAAVMELNKGGWRAATHAVGDAAVDQVLQGYELANVDKDIKQGGWTIEHAFVSRADQYPRIKALNLRMSVQDHLYLVAPVLKGYWGMDRASEVTPVKAYLDQGFMVAGGTDASVIPLNPFWVLYHFVTRGTISAGVYGADQAITRDAALRLLTINYAKLVDESDVKGSIEASKVADFVVLSADYLSIPAAEIENLKPVATFVNGKKVYQDASVPL